jgi:hypothetical protein
MARTLTKPKGRPKGRFIKDLRYEKFYFITFRYRDDFVYVDINNTLTSTYIPVEQFDVEKHTLVSFEKQRDAKEFLDTLTQFDIDGEVIYPEILHNTLAPRIMEMLL